MPVAGFPGHALPAPVIPIERGIPEGFLAEHLDRLRAFVRLRMPPELRGDGALVNWLFGAVENAVRDLLERQRVARRDPAREARGSTTALFASYATFCPPSRGGGAREEVERIEAAMDAIPPAPAFVGMQLFLQFAQVELDGQGGLASLSSSNGLALTLGSF